MVYGSLPRQTSRQRSSIRREEHAVQQITDGFVYLGRLEIWSPDGSETEEALDVSFYGWFGLRP
jgi:hypothetical protein